MSVQPLARSTPTSLTLVTDAARLDALRDEWLDLMGRSGTNEVMLTPDWLTTWWQTFGTRQGRELRVGLVREGERLIGLAPFVRRRSWHRRLLPFRRLEFLGTGEDEADSVCSEYLNVIAERGAEERVAAAVVDAVVAGTFGGWDEVVLPRMAGDTPMPALLVAAFRRAGVAAAATQTTVSWHLPLPATWDAYLASLGKKYRYQVRQTIRLFEEWSGAPGRLERATSVGDLGRATEVLVALHRQRWDGDEHGGGTFRSPRFLAFHETVTRRLFEQGAVELAWLSAHGRPVAAMYGLVWDDKVSYYQCGRAVDVPAAVRPGIALLCYAIHDAIAAGRREFDFLHDDAVYKRQLATASRPLVDVRAARGGLVETARGWLERGIASTRGLRAAWRRPRGQAAEPSE